MSEKKLNILFLTREIVFKPFKSILFGIKLRWFLIFILNSIWFGKI